MNAAEFLPALNACLNATSGVFLFLGWRAIRARRIDVHRKRMLGAVVASAVFLVFYGIRFALTGAHPYPATDWTRGAYLFILGTHSVLAAVVVPLVVRALWLAFRERFAEHRRLVRWLFPVWAYVSVTGVVVYLMLYHVGPWRAGP